MPAFISIIVWRGLFNLSSERWGTSSTRSWGLRRKLTGLAGRPVLGEGGALVVNMWLTFPYMFLVVTGALTAIPAELLEAARVDGARSHQRLPQDHLPLLMVGIALPWIGSFAVASSTTSI